MRKIIVWTPINTSGHFPKLENDPRWMNRRVEIMNSYTIPSMRAQTCKDFEWWIEVREDTVDHFVHMLDLGGVPAVILPRPIVTDHQAGENTAWEREHSHVEERIAEQEFIEVRLNSDDLYRRTFIESLQKMEIAPDLQAVLPRSGYYWFVREKQLYKVKHSSPPFYALVYNTAQWLEGYRHPMPGGHMAAKKLRNRDMVGRQWVWLIHDVNNKIMRKGQGAYSKKKKGRPVNLKRLQEFGQ